jgi:hypothetical protein
VFQPPCVPYVSAQSQDFLAADQENKQEPSRGRSSDDSRAIATQIRLKSSAYMVNDQFILSRLRAHQEATGAPRAEP